MEKYELLPAIKGTNKISQARWRMSRLSIPASWYSLFSPCCELFYDRLLGTKMVIYDTLIDSENNANDEYRRRITTHSSQQAD
ncbi:MAG TPA: hypothetical protein VFK06_13290 [Candidatus Angelobacter sp.]|nr:hypothetical protein [Candidatus Angelobacter sp.]